MSEYRVHAAGRWWVLQKDHMYRSDDLMVYLDHEGWWPMRWWNGVATNIDGPWITMRDAMRAAAGVVPEGTGDEG